MERGKTKKVGYFEDKAKIGSLKSEKSRRILCRMGENGVGQYLCPHNF